MRLRALVPSRLTCLTRLRALRAFAPNAPSCLTCLRALRTLRAIFAICLPYSLAIQNLLLKSILNIYTMYLYEKTFRSDLSTQKKPLLWRITYFQSVTFCCYLFIPLNFVRFFYEYFFYWAFLLISHSAFFTLYYFSTQIEMNW